MAPGALQELERALILFRLAKDFCPRAMQIVVSFFLFFTEYYTKLYKKTFTF